MGTCCVLVQHWQDDVREVERLDLGVLEEEAAFEIDASHAAAL